MLGKAIAKNFLMGVSYVLRDAGQALDRLGSKMTDDVAYLEKYSRHRKLMPIYELWPSYGNSFIAPNASLVGEVLVGNNCAVWYGAVLKGDKFAVRIQDNVFIGENSSITTIYNLPKATPSSVTIASNVVIEEGCSLISCIVDSFSLIGKGSVIQGGARIERGVILRPGTVVGPGNLIPSFTIWEGNPAKYVRDVTEADFKLIEKALQSQAESAKRNFDLLSSLGHNLTTINTP
ncbi:unnamed protein product [Blepharisma stoltei]|uniref:Gamma carbonic anhydrase n=1 Tax=Blepharisma stoltei TaxID=1481888 RepID=A0AAU9K5X0_9CILI|nr:unnamed protein product [Blepharisma stoltei]